MVEIKNCFAELMPIVDEMVLNKLWETKKDAIENVTKDHLSYKRVC